MKRIILTVAILSLSFAAAQKKEISNAYKAIESGDNATATAQLSAAEAIMGEKTYLLDPSTLEQYYYTKGLVLLNFGKTQEGATYLSKINDMGRMKIYSGKNENRERVYFVGKVDADKSGISGLKEDSYTPSTSSKLGEKINPVLKSTNQAALDAYNSKNYATAGDKFKETYYLLKASGTDDKSILMNAAIAYSNAEKLDESIILYNDLIDSGYTGVETSYTAKNKKTGTVDRLDKSTWDIFQKMGASADYTDFKTETTKSVENDLYSINAKNLYNKKRYNEAITLAEKGLAKFPGNSDLMNIKGLSFYGNGKSAEFIDILKKQVAENPNDADAWFNLGVMQTKDPATKSEAEKDFNKAVEIKPTYAAAWQNLTQMKIGDDDKTRADYSIAKKAGKNDEANKILEQRKARFLAALPYAEKWYAAAPNDLGVVNLLKILYTMSNNDAKAAEFKTKESALKTKEAK